MGALSLGGSTGRCPYCQSAPIETVRRVWYLRSYVLFARYGSHFLVGCRSCTVRAIRRSLLINAATGWWGVPWGLGTPVVIAQNLLQLLARSEDQTPGAPRPQG